MNVYLEFQNSFFFCLFILLPPLTPSPNFILAQPLKKNLMGLNTNMLALPKKEKEKKRSITIKKRVKNSTLTNTLRYVNYKCNDHPKGIS